VAYWSVSDSPLTAFRVYRVPVGGADFELLSEVPAQPDVQQYTYVDAHLLPGQSYVYVVEGLGVEGQSAFSQAITVNALEALPGQLAILVASLVIAYGATASMQRLLSDGWGHWKPSCPTA
jgi:hypothetical protein